MAGIKLVSLKKSFGDVTAVNEIDIDVKDKEFFVLLGPTGAGKTTTLRLIAGLGKPDNGDIYFLIMLRSLLKQVMSQDFL